MMPFQHSTRPSSSAYRLSAIGYRLFPPLTTAFLLLYAFTAAPGVLSGDSAEFQLAAVALGIPHPTTYPLYTLLGHLTTILIPVGDLAWRVTLLSSVCAALTVGLFALLVRRVSGSSWMALIGALALGLTPGLWNAATIAEVYALLALLIVALALALMPLANNSNPSPVRFWPAALIAGLGFTHHGLFVITALPLFAFASLYTLWRTPRAALPAGIALLALCFAAGMLPWAYPFIQYARFGPFDGIDYGLPRHYFWGAPQSWGEVLDLLTGGTIRRGIFQLPTADGVLATFQLVGRRLLFEFGPVGVILGLIGAGALLRQVLWIWCAAAWIFFASFAYLLLLGPAVGDAPVFTLPMLLPWALWIAAGAAALVHYAQSLPVPWKRWQQPLLVALLILLALGWGATRYRVSAKQHLTLYHDFAIAALTQLPPDAIVITHWEQGMTLQYLRLVEHQRPDVWVDVVEPGDDPWLARARRHYPDRPVYFIGQPASVTGIPVELVRDEIYADVYRLIDQVDR